MKFIVSALLAALIATVSLCSLSPSADAAVLAPTYTPTLTSGGSGNGGNALTQGANRDRKIISDCLRACFDACKEDLEECEDVCTVCKIRPLGLFCLASTLEDDCYDFCISAAMAAHQACRDACAG